MKLTSEQRETLKAFGPDTYGMEVRGAVRKSLLDAGLIEWVPPKFGTQMYAITDAGRSALEKGV